MTHDSPASPSSSDRSPAGRFAWHGVLVVFGLAMAGSHGLVAWLVGAVDAGGALLRALGVVGIATVAGALGYRVLGRSSFAAQAVAAGVALAVALWANTGAVATMREARAAARAQADPQQLFEEILDRSLADLEGLAVSETVERLTTIATNLRELVTENPAGSVPGMVATAATLETVAPELQALDARLRELVHAEGLTPTTAPTREALAGRLEAVEQALAAHERLRASLAKLPPGPLARRLPATLQGFEPLASALAPCRELHALLLESWGHWQYDRETGTLTILEGAPEDLLARYRRGRVEFLAALGQEAVPAESDLEQRQRLATLLRAVAERANSQQVESTTEPTP
ncbi:MAG: hypothetical protein KF858_01950 [Candidatus Sumerlaeia bacterium]|nr:hypothetical protein [Candidatus Sumerlaeia bacterium]